MNIYLDDMRCSIQGCKNCLHVNSRFVRNASQYVTDDFVHFTTVKEVQTHLHQGIVEFMSLDHDLGACATCTNQNAHIGNMTTPDTTFFNWCPHVLDGTKLVLWMAENNVWPRYKPVVHSHNPVGKARMQGIINRYFPGASGTDGFNGNI